MKKIPMCEPQLYGDEWSLVKECLDTNWISSKGRFVGEFERLFAEFCGRGYAVSVTNGTAALHLAVAALGIGPGDEVIVPALSIISCPNAVRLQGAGIRAADALPDTWNIDPDDIRRKITERTRAVMVIHTYGCPADMAVIEEICRDHDLFLIEDAAEAHGALYRGKRTGGFGDVSCFSFYANKIITTGEGGMLLTDDPEIARRARQLKDLAFTPEQRYFHRELGFNYRMTNIQAAIGVAQMAHIETSIRSRRRNAALYQERLKSIPGLRLPVEPSDNQSVYWYYSVVVEDDFALSRDELRRRLAEQGIESRDFFFPIHRQPIYPELGDESCPVAEFLGGHGLNLPSGNLLSHGDIDYICDSIRRLSGG
jgi:perosamine synthetase